MFHQENDECNELTEKEHIIQKKLGGSLSSRQILCNNCNKYFSRAIDEELVKLYRPILINIAPIIPGNLKNIFMEPDSTDDVLPLRIRAGGVAEAKKRIKIKRDNHGKVTQIIARDNISEEHLIEIAERQGVSPDFIKITRVPISEYESEYSFETLITKKTLRAVLLDLFELVKHCTITKSFPDLVSSSKLKAYRLWIRKGFSSKELMLPAIPVAPIETILDSLFEPSTFSHKLAICYDKSSDWLILSAQFLDTMPWLFIFPNLSLDFSSFSILYKKALVEGNDYFDIKDKPLLNRANMHWPRFSDATRESNNFARIKFLMAFREQQSRSAYVLDMKDDVKISQMLAGYVAEFKKTSSRPEVRSIVEVLRKRYSKSPHSKEIENLVKEKAGHFLPENTCISKNGVLNAYRECLKFIANNKKYGYPKLLEDIGPLILV